MRIRPIYETQADRDSEQDFAKWFGSSHFPGYSVEKLHVSYKLDFAVYADHDGRRPRTLVGFAEFKDRSRRYAWTDFARDGVYRLSFAKWSAAHVMCLAADVPFYLAVRCSDGTWVARFSAAQMVCPVVCHDGRRDRTVYDPVSRQNVQDPGDLEPMVEIDATRFIQVRGA